MKKMKRQAVCILAVLALIFTLAGCSASGSDKKAFLGTWKVTVDLTDLINEDLQKGYAGVDEEWVDHFQFSDVDVTLVYTFNKDDTYSIRLDQDVLNATVDHMKDEFKDVAVMIIESSIAKSGRDMTVEELLESQGLDLDGFIDRSVDFDATITKSIVDTFNGNGQWKAENGELYLSKSVVREAEDLSALYEITSDGIRLTLPEGSADEMGIYPLLLKKA